MNKTLLFVNGLDPSGGRGLLVDQRMVHNFRFFSCAAVTCLYYQNSAVINGIEVLPVPQVAQQLDAIFSDMTVHGAKLSGILDPGQAKLMASLLPTFKVPVTVFAPRFFTFEGKPLLPEEHIRPICEALFPICSATILHRRTAEFLLGRSIPDVNAMREAVKQLEEMGAKTLVLTGGDLPGRAVDTLLENGHVNSFDEAKQPTDNRLGMGDAFGAFLLCSVVRGSTMPQAVHAAKMYLRKTQIHTFHIGKGLHPINLNTPL
jgi:hydroxymethylpyrimidine/phosphomethylpyrimidine kinase